MECRDVYVQRAARLVAVWLTKRSGDDRPRHLTFELALLAKLRISGYKRLPSDCNLVAYFHRSLRERGTSRARLTLQLQFHLKMRFLGGGLMGPSPEGPCDDVCWLDASVREPCGYAANFLNGPADKRRVTKIWGIIALARWRIVAIMAKASMTSETWRFHPCQERVSL